MQRRPRFTYCPLWFVLAPRIWNTMATNFNYYRYCSITGNTPYILNVDGKIDGKENQSLEQIVLYVYTSNWCVILICVWMFVGEGPLLLQRSNAVAAWWRHKMEPFSPLLALCAGNSPFIGEFPSQRPETRSFDVFVDLCLTKRWSKQSWGWWFEMPLRSLRRPVMTF